MKPAKSSGLIIVVIALWGLASPLIAGGSPAETAEGGPAGERSDYGSALPPANVATAVKPDSSAGGLQTGPQGNSGSSAPGVSYLGGTNDTSTAVQRERGVAGSGLPRENVSEVDTKTLRTSKTDGKFSGSLLDVGVKSVSDVKSTTGKNLAAGKKDQAQQKKSASSRDASQESKTQTSTDLSEVADKH